MGFGDFVTETRKKISKAAGDVTDFTGISDIGTKAKVKGSLLGSLTGSGVVGTSLGAFIGGLRGKKVEAAKLDAEQSGEEERRQFNDDIFSIAQRLQGGIAQDPSFDFESLSFLGEDPRTEMLKKLVGSFSARAGEVSQGMSQPGLSQTRLSLVE